MAKEHLCKRLNIRYYRIKEKDSAEEVVAEIRRVFQKEHVHIASMAVDDIKILRNYFFERRRREQVGDLK